MDRQNRHASSSQPEASGSKRAGEPLHHDQVGMSLYEGSDDGGKDVRPSKKPRLVWTTELHQRFLNAVNHLGVKSAVPKTILQLMNVEGMTRENVASHLQKYRLYLKRLAGLPPNAQLPDDRGPGMGYGGQFPPGDAMASLQAMQGHGMKMGRQPPPSQPAPGGMLGMGGGGAMGPPPHMPSGGGGTPGGAMMGGKYSPPGGPGSGEPLPNRAGPSGHPSGHPAHFQDARARPGGGDPRAEVKNSHLSMVNANALHTMLSVPGMPPGAGGVGAASGRMAGWPEFPGPAPHQGYMGTYSGYPSPGPSQYGSSHNPSVSPSYLPQGGSAGYSQEAAAVAAAAVAAAANAAVSGGYPRMGNPPIQMAGGQAAQSMSTAASIHAVAMAAGMLGMQGGGQHAQPHGRRWWEDVNAGVGGAPAVGSGVGWPVGGGGPGQSSLPGGMESGMMGARLNGHPNQDAFKR
ncbi:hypothetical protein CYMTET_56560 [Cymbomonas tetramitiformis]|uniref:HTH myb-type domain-containing protein n=1 Tax=Cymbomonas tetramitiformis TaxID=36881 RepID=A0AAE0ELP3_9CHLO|nr:hypothetical protein CYMTET_56560 [Cymbomonas tetramitiformis]